MSVYLKDPSAVVDYTIDWATYLADGETLSSSDWSVEPDRYDADDAPLELKIDSDTNDTDSATVWVSGGLVGSVYRLTNRVATSASRTDDRSIRIRVEHR